MYIYMYACNSYLILAFLEREGGREGREKGEGREGGREGEMEGGKEGEREGGREGRRERGRVGGRVMHGGTAAERKKKGSYLLRTLNKREEHPGGPCGYRAP